MLQTLLFLQWISSIPEYSARIPRVIPRVRLDGLVARITSTLASSVPGISTCRQSPSPIASKRTHTRPKQKKKRAEGFPREIMSRESALLATLRLANVADYTMTRKIGATHHHHHDRTRRMHFIKNRENQSRVAVPPAELIP